MASALFSSIVTIMKAWIINKLEGLSALQLTDFPDPRPAAGEVILDVAYAALNPADRYLAEGAYPSRPKFPHILGRDGAGTITAIGPDVTNWKPGDRALILRSDIGVSRAGTFAQHVTVPVDCLAEIPADWSMQQASGASLIYLTAHQALTMWGDLPPGIVLITGASGGVGVASLQLARALGHRIICLSRSAAKQAKLMEMGAELCLDPTQPTWPKKLKEHLGEKRVDLVIDNIGGPMFNDALETLGMNGKVSCVGRLAGPVPQFNTANLFFRRLRIGGVAASTYTREEAHRTWERCVKLLEQTHQLPLIDRVFPFDQLLEAFEYLAKGPMGKVLVAVNSPLEV